jgi:Ca-activated chloride channel family protein
MSDILHNFHFLRPWWLLALACLPLLWLALKRQGSDAGAWRGAIDAHLLQHLLVAGDELRATQLPRWLAAAAWTLACIALAGPAWEQLPQPLFQNRAARVFALELSSTMSAQDVKPSRYERARYKIADLLKRSGDMQTALIAYAGDAFVVAPLTDDANTVANLLDALEPSVMPAPGNDTGRAIDLGAKLIEQAGLQGGELLLLADAPSDNALAAARRARDAGVRVSVLGIGTAQGAPVALPQGGFLKNDAGDIVLPKLATSALAELAQAGGGRYAPVSMDSGDMDAVLAASPARSAAQARTTQVTTTRFRDRGPWLLLALMPLVAFGFRRGWLMLLPCVLMTHSPDASAFGWRDLWQRPDQQARAELDAGHAKDAQTLARDPALRGAAAYKAEDFAAATQDFAQRADADAAYNRGNALAKLKQYPQAIAAYDEALKLAPDMTDATANKRAVEDWLKQQQQQERKQQQEQKDRQDAQDQAQQQNGGSGDPQQDQKPGDQQQAQSKAQDQSQQNQSGQRGQSQDDAAAKPEQEASAAARQAAEQKYKQTMDKELAQQPDDGREQKSEPKPIRLGAREGGAQDEHAQAVEQWLQRVPDDPGGLLRRKFQLEYQLRQHGDKAGEGGR